MDDSAFRYFGVGIVCKPCPSCGCGTAVGFDRNDPGVHDREATECTCCMAAKISNEVQFSRADQIPLAERGECANCRGPARVYGPKGRQLCAECQTATPRKEPDTSLKPCRRPIPQPRASEPESVRENELSLFRDSRKTWKCQSFGGAMKGNQARGKVPDSAARAMTPVQVRITGATEDVEQFAEFLTGLHQISASPMTLRARSRGVAQGYMTVHIGGEST